MSHRKTGRPVGRPKGAVSTKRRMAHEIIAALEEEMGRSMHPLEALLRVGHDDTKPLELRCACLRDCLPYVLPRLQSTAIHGPNNGPICVAELDVTAIMANPELARAAQDLALGMVKQERTQRGLADPTRLLDA